MSTSVQNEATLMSYVLMAVPAHLVPEIAELIAAHGGNTTVAVPSIGSSEGVPTPAVTGSQSSSPVFVNGWTEATLERAYKESGDPMRRLLVYLADHAGQEVTSEEIAEGIGVAGWNSVAGMLGAFGRRAANHYGCSGGPWESRWDTEGRARMKMPAAVAEIIKRVAAE